MEIQQLDNFMPISLNDKFFLAEQLVKSGLLPQGFNTPAKAMVALQMGHELGLKPMVALNNISVVNGRPTLGADLMVAIIRQHPEYAGMNIEGNDKKCTVVIKRKNGDIVDTFTSTFTIEEAVRAQLTGKDNWKKYPQRMLKHRAISYCAKDAFPDALAGIYTPEEMEGVSGSASADPEKLPEDPRQQNQSDAGLPDQQSDAGPAITPEVLPKGNFKLAVDALNKAKSLASVVKVDKTRLQFSWTEDEDKQLVQRIQELKKHFEDKIITGGAKAS